MPACQQGWNAFVISPRPGTGRQGLLLPVEHDRWQVILTGLAGMTRLIFTLIIHICWHLHMLRVACLLRVVHSISCFALHAGDHPPTDEEGYLEFAKSLPQKDIYEAIKQAEPIGPVYTYSRTENVRRHYEKVGQSVNYKFEIVARFKHVRVSDSGPCLSLCECLGLYFHTFKS